MPSTVMQLNQRVATGSGGWARRDGDHSLKNEDLGASPFAAYMVAIFLGGTTIYSMCDTELMPI